MGWRNRAYSPVRTSVSRTDGMWVRRPSRRWPQITGTAPTAMSSHPGAGTAPPGTKRNGAAARQARMYPKIHSGIPSALRRIIVAIWPRRTPHRREKAAVNVLAPPRTNPSTNGKRNAYVLMPRPCPSFGQKGKTLQEVHLLPRRDLHVGLLPGAQLPSQLDRPGVALPRHGGREDGVLSAGLLVGHRARRDRASQSRGSLRGIRAGSYS